MTETMEESVKRRADLARLLALSDWPLVRSLTDPLRATPHQRLRGPEAGLIMLRGRMGSTGSAFNLGEATTTRCSVRLEDATVGHGYVLGRNGELAERAALCDALAQGSSHAEVLEKIMAQLENALLSRRKVMEAKVAATKVDFFTLVRGDV